MPALVNVGFPPRRTLDSRPGKQSKHWIYTLTPSKADVGLSPRQTLNARPGKRWIPTKANTGLSAFFHKKVPRKMNRLPQEELDQPVQQTGSCSNSGVLGVVLGVGWVLGAVLGDSAKLLSIPASYVLRTRVTHTPGNTSAHLAISPRSARLGGAPHSPHWVPDPCEGDASSVRALAQFEH